MPGLANVPEGEMGPGPDSDEVVFRNMDNIFELSTLATTFYPLKAGRSSSWRAKFCSDYPPPSS